MENKPVRKNFKAKLLAHTTLVLLLVFVIGASSVFAALSAIWSPSSGPMVVNPAPVMPAALSAVSWNGTTITAADSVTLSTTISPLPSHVQTVSFYLTSIPNPTSATPILGVTDDPATGLYPLGNNASLGNKAMLTVSIPEGTWYFIARIATPA